jgi:hypothetical protein
MIKYKITITKIETVETKVANHWVVLDKRPWTDKDFEDRSTRYDGHSFFDKTPLKEVMGYAPEKTVSEQVKTKVLIQTVDDLDLPAVIKAINKL